MTVRFVSAERYSAISISTTAWLSARVPFKKTDILHSIATLPGLDAELPVVGNNIETGGAALTWLREQIIAPHDGLHGGGSGIGAHGAANQVGAWLLGAGYKVDAAFAAPLRQPSQGLLHWLATSLQQVCQLVHGHDDSRPAEPSAVAALHLQHDLLQLGGHGGGVLRHRRRNMRQPCQRGKAPALRVDQDHLQFIGRVEDRQRSQHGTRQRRFAAARGADNEDMNHVGRDQAQQQRLAVFLYAEHSRRTWADWLKKEAQHGGADALAALRAREAAQGLKGITIRGEGQAKPGHAPAVDNITKKGTIIFRAGMSAVRDDGDRLQVSREATREGLQEALRLAMQRYGNRITVNGTVEFKAQMIRAAVDSQLPITFTDPALESRRQALLNKENTHERTERPEHRGRTGRGAGGPGQRPAADQHATGAAAVARAGDGRPAAGRGDRADAGLHAATVHRKPDVGRLGRKPPPQSQHRLRALSELGVVRIAGGSEVLLPRDVPRHLEQQGTQPDHQLRRDISRPGSGVAAAPPGLAAADKYIAERESKRSNGFDIPKHARYTAGEGGLAFEGVRNIEGQALALLKRGDEVMVMPIDQATARRMSRIAVGDAVTITPKGSIKTSKGRSR